MRNQLARLFGKESRLGRREEMTSAQWRVALRTVLDHLYRYLKSNVQTDEVHFTMLCTGLAAARESLDEADDFWPGYAEGITRLALLLMGDLPDHQNSRPGSRKKGHFSLSCFRTLHYSQDPLQKLSTLVAAHRIGLAGFEGNPYHALDEFRAERGFKAGYDDFIAWYKRKYPQNYALVF